MLSILLRIFSPEAYEGLIGYLRDAVAIQLNAIRAIVET